MSKTKFGTVYGCRRLSIRLDPDPDTECETELGEVVKTWDETIEDVKEGTDLEYDDSQICWDRWGNKYMKVWTESGREGWVPVGALKPINHKKGDS